MKIIGIDYGTKAIGVSASDALLVTASPVTIIRRGEDAAIKKPIAEIKRLAADLNAERIVLGYPKKLDNSASGWTLEIEAFAKRLEKEVKIPVILWDERFSTVTAERMLIEADFSRKKRKEKIDAVAATIILQHYLDHLHNQAKNEVKREKNKLKIRWRMNNLENEYDEILGDDETEEFDVIVLTDEETGEDIELVIVDSEESGDCTYLLVVASADFDDEEPTASIIKEIKDENGEFVYEVVDDENEFEKASELFKDSDDFDIV